MRRLVRSLVAGALLVPVVASVALAHPLGNFTINHYAGIRVEPDRVLLDVVIDQAEIPTFQATMTLDADGDGEFSADEIAGVETEWCTRVGHELTLTVDGAAAPTRVVAAGVTFPAGNGGLSTMRLVCTIESPFAAPLAGPAEIAFADGFEPTRIGWREITVAGSGVTVSGTTLDATSPSARLTAYPSTLAAAPDVRSATFTVTPGGAALPALVVPDASPIEPIELTAGAAPSAAPSPSASSSASSSPAASGAAGPSAAASPGAGGAVASPAPGAAVPGGEGAIPDILRALPVTPFVALLAFATAALLGAGHALTPGHGKTLMAAYLVGTRGTPRHALGLGAAVSISHTFGILGLAVVVLAAESALPPDVVVRVAPIVAALTIVGIGGWMLLTEVRRWAAARRRSDAILAAHAHVHADGAAHTHERVAAHGHDHTHDHGPDGAHAHEHGAHPAAGLEHSHGGIRHSHVPPAGSTITWRSLAILGLAGGLIPSTNALLILLATIAAGQPVWGIVLVVAFGLGMAAVMAGVGLAFVYARGLIERGASTVGFGRVARLVPLAASVIVLVVGVALTTQAVTAARLG